VADDSPDLRRRRILGCCDIVVEMYESGELVQKLRSLE